MDRDTFSINRRDRHFGRVGQNCQTFARNDISSVNNRKTLRDTYLNDAPNGNSGSCGAGANRGLSELFTHSGFSRPLSPFNANSFSFKTEPFRSLTPPHEDDFSRDVSDLSSHVNSLGFNENSRRGLSPSNEMPKYMRINRLSSLPTWTLDENREIRHDLTLKKVVEEGLILLFAMDKSGCHFLQSNYYGEKTRHVEPQLRARIAKEVLGNREVFLTICKNIFGNFFLQRVIEFSDFEEQEIIKRYIVSDIAALCLDKSACRVVQTALEKLNSRFADAIVAAIPRKYGLMDICTDQNANHVIQKIVKMMPLSKWEFIVTFLCKTDHDNLLDVCQDKYGCRVVQTIVEVLSKQNVRNKIECEEKTRVLRKLMARILAKCQKLASNEFANYVIQHIIETPGVLSDYRNAIIENCLLRNLLSMSQEKYASHVVERAFCYAPTLHVSEMMEEIFDGYVPHPETGKDALDILIFHQFGNYVIQRILQICVDAVLGTRETTINGVDRREKFEEWLTKLYLRSRREKARLMRFSSGKKILDILEGMEQSNKFYPPHYECPSLLLHSSNSSSQNDILSSLFSPSNTTSIEWPSRKNSLSSEQHDFDYGFQFPKY